MPQTHLRETVQLFISCKNLKNADLLSKSDPFVVVIENGAQIGKTETIQDNLNPHFSTPITLQYEFERHQKLLFSVRDCDKSGNFDELGFVEMSLGEIVTPGPKIGRNKKLGESKNGKFEVVRIAGNLMSEITVKAINQDSGDCWYYEIGCYATNLDKMDLFGKSDPYFEIWNEDNMLYRSEVIVQDLNPRWKTFELNKGRLENGKLLFKIFDCDEDNLIGTESDFMGEFRINVDTCDSGQKYDITRSNKKKKHGVFNFQKFQARKRKRFLDYIQSGLRLNFSCAIDFTGSNGDPSQPSSLHFRSRSATNQYTDALAPTITVIQDYDDDKIFPCYGFGAKIRSSGEVSHCFPLGVAEDREEMFNLDDILQNYWGCMNRIQLWGPTFFAPTINKILNDKCDPENPDEYQVLLIVTDGAITDLEDTINSVARAQTLPLSMIIVGVGDADFTSMEILDGDSNEYQFANLRDCVQFVSFKETEDMYHADDGNDMAARFHGVKELLAGRLLEELPRQVEDYMKLKGYDN